MEVIKEQVIPQLAAQFPSLGLENIDLNRIRLREKAGENKLTSVLHEKKELARYSMFDGKELAIEVLPTIPVEPYEFREAGYLTMVKTWDPSTWEMSEMK